ncbi:hypothetical protein [Bosea sp. LC85]|uniref:hypothetical protein n=1 Tax=Bosea sp. LC85 TaxID=1502851 RepID=UPI0005B8E0BC|nr:hypothetical protein [Bosea sp. LC85]
MSDQPRTPDDLFLKRLDALYCTDPNGRLVCTNEWDWRPAPRFHLMRTAQGPIFRCRTDVPEEVVSRLGELCRTEPLDRAFEKQPVHRDRYLEILAEHAAVEKLWSGPSYRAVRDPFPAATATLVTPENAALLQDGFEDWLPDIPHRQPFLAVVKEGRAVSICASVRITAAVHCAGVETHADHRRSGHAAQAVAAWARAVRSLGAAPFYSTSWDNIASQGVARRLDMELAGVDFHVT